MTPGEFQKEINRLSLLFVYLFIAKCEHLSLELYVNSC